MISCTYCNKYSDLMCGRCGTAYCSLECQRSDRKNHRPFCSMHPIESINEPMPKFQAFDSNTTEKNKNGRNMLQETRTTKMHVNTDNVRIMHVIDHSTICIHYINYTNHQEYITCMYEAFTSASKAKNLIRMPLIDSFVLAPFGGLFYRALVLKILHNENVLVNLIDIGNTIQVKYFALKRIKKKLLSYKHYGKRIVLKDIPEYTDVSAKMEKALAKFIENSTEFTAVECRDAVGNKTFVLADIHTNETLNDKLLAMIDRNNEDNFIESSVVSNGDERPIEGRQVFAKNILYKLFQGNDVRVIVLDNSCTSKGYVTCIAYDDLKLFRKNRLKIQKYCEQLDEPENYSPSLNEVCLVKTYTDNNDGYDWDRAICLKHFRNGYISAVLIDYGEIVSVKISNIQEIPASLLFPCISVICYIADFYDPCENRISAENSYCLQKYFPLYKRSYFEYVRPMNNECACLCKLKQNERME